MRVRVLAAGALLLAAGCVILGRDSHAWHAAPISKTDRRTASPNLLAAAQLAPTPLVSAASMTASPAEKAISRAEASSLLAHLPLFFEPNQGQANLDPTDSRARFIAHGSGFSLALGAEGAILTLRSHKSNPQSAEKAEPAKTESAKKSDTAAALATLQSVRMKLAGANPNARISGSDLLPGKSNYILGGDSANWRSNIPQYARVRYEDVYPGINLVFYGNQGRLEYDFQVAPGADPARVELEFDGAKLRPLKDGSLQLHTGTGDVRLEAPRVYQKIDGREQPVSGHFVLRGANRAGFAVGPYDRSRKLVIDPILAFSAYFGGAGDEAATFIAVDSSGNIYLTGSTDSLPPTAGTFPITSGVLQSTLNSTPPATNVYIAKINPVITPNNPTATLVYATYLGGSGSDAPVGIAVDGAQNTYVAGTTSSTNFPTTTTGYQTASTLENPGASHVFVTELNATATGLVYSSYLSGNGTDAASGVTIDNAGFIYVTGSTTSTDTPLTSTTTQFPASQLPNGIAFQSKNLGPTTNPLQFFVTKVNTISAGSSSIAYSTYFGGSFTASSATAVATGGGIAVDPNGNIYFDGTTNYTYTNGEVGDFPILDAYQPCLNTLAPTVVTNPPVCPAATSADTDAFFAKLDPNVAQGEQLQFSSYFGGIDNDSGTGIAVDTGAVNVFITGTTSSPGITGTSNFASFQQCLDTPVNPTNGTAGCSTSVTASDAYVARFTPQSPTATIPNLILNYFSYLGGTGNDEGLAITVDSSDNAYLTGWTQSTDFPVFPTPSNLQSGLGGTQSAFIAHLNTTTTNGQNQTGAFASYFGGTAPATALTQGTGVALDVNNNIYFAGNTNSTNLQVTGLQEGSNFVNSNLGGFDAFATELKTAAGISITGLVTLGTNQTVVSAGNPVTFTYTVTNNGPDPATNLTFQDDLGQNGGVNLAFVSANITGGGTCSGGGTNGLITCSILSLQVGGIATATVEVTPAATGSETKFNGGAVQVLSPNSNPILGQSVWTAMSDFSVSVSPNNNSVTVAGDTAIYQVKITPIPVYGANIALSCTGVPTGAACTFAPSNTVTLPSTSPGAATLNLTTTARPIVTGSAKSGFGRYYAVWLIVPAFALVGVGATGNRRRRRILGFLMLCALFTQILLLPACSSAVTQPPVSGTPAGTYNITVTATSGSDSHSYGIQLTVP